MPNKCQPIRRRKHLAIGLWHQGHGTLSTSLTLKFSHLLLKNVNIQLTVGVIIVLSGEESMLRAYSEASLPWRGDHEWWPFENRELENLYVPNWLRHFYNATNAASLGTSFNLKRNFGLVFSPTIRRMGSWVCKLPTFFNICK
jgi:hypothetical protein